MTRGVRGLLADLLDFMAGWIRPHPPGVPIQWSEVREGDWIMVRRVGWGYWREGVVLQCYDISGRPVVGGVDAVRWYLYYFDFGHHEFHGNPQNEVRLSQRRRGVE